MCRVKEREEQMIVLDSLDKFIEEGKKVKNWATENGIPLWEKEMCHYTGLYGSIRMGDQHQRNYTRRMDWLKQNKEGLIKAGIDWDIIYTQQLHNSDKPQADIVATTVSVKFFEPKVETKTKQKTWYFDVIFRLESFWVGCHYSYQHKSFCVGLLPCVIIRIAKTPYVADDK